MPSVGFEPTISAGERPQTYGLDRAATGNDGLCPIKGQISGLCTRIRARNLVLDPVSENYQDLATLPNVGYPTSVLSFLYSA